MRMIGKEIFIVREIAICDDYGSIRIDEEELFDSIEGANDYLQSLREVEPSENDMLLLRLELSSFILGDEGQLKENSRSLYSIKGDRLHSHNSTRIDETEVQYKGTFKIGEIVRIKPKIIENSSPFIKGGYGVITSVPIKKADWVEQEGELSDWNYRYLVHYITENGIVDHKHICEQAMIGTEGGVPDELVFLNYYSMYLKGENKVEGEVMNMIINEIIYAKKSKIIRVKSTDEISVGSTFIV